MKWIVLLLLLAATVFMSWVSWLKWSDLIIDFGEQAYIPWQLSEGAVLYRDIVYFYGPLSSYLHALLFKIFGAHFIVLAGFNIALVALLTLLIFRLFFLTGSLLSATSASLTFLGVFAFAQYLWMGNHNFVCSYVYDVTHGIFLSVLAACQFSRFARSRKPASLMLLGLISGLILLTKIEVSLAWTVAVLSGLLLLHKSWNLTLRDGWNWMIRFVPYFLLPTILFTVYFAWQMGWSEAVQAMLGPWTYVLNTSIGSLSFYQAVMGTDQLGPNLIRIFKYLAGWTLFLAALGFLNHGLRKPLERSPLLGFLAGVLFLLALQAAQSFIPWLQLLKPLPLVMLGLSVFLFIQLWKRKTAVAGVASQAVLATFVIFSTVLMLKIFFNAHVYHYGTALVMPASLIFFKMLIDEVSLKLRERSGTHLFFRGTVLAGLLFFISIHFMVSFGFYSKKVFPVGSGGNTLMSYDPGVAPNGLLFQIALDILNKDMKEGDTLATFPTGTLLNFMVRKPNTIDSISFNPGTLLLIGEERTLKALEAAPPTHVAIFFHDYREFGARFFGSQFGQSIYQWVLDHYDSFKVIGHDPVRDQKFGIHLFKRRTGAPSRPPDPQ